MGGPKTRRHSKISELPEAVRKEVERLLLEPDITYEDIEEHLKREGHDISHSSIGRYGKHFLNQVRELRIIEDKAKALVSDSGEGLVLEEAASKLATRSIIQILLDEGVNGAKIPYLISDLARLQASSVKREQFKADFRKRADKVFRNAEKKAKGMTKEEMLQFIKEEVYGLA